MRAILCYSGWFLSAGITGLSGQSSDISPVKVREQLVAEAQKVLAERSGDLPKLEKYPNPFFEKPLPEAAIDPASLELGVPSQATGPLPSDLVVKAALSIPATGTASLGGQTFLLTGQKKFKVGDKLSVDVDGLPYEVVISSITPTSFTVTKGGFSHTRAIRLQSTTSTPAPRP